ncbi:MAG: plasmid mobilization relaxosome protein MobC [Staphylococcus aureus]|nr:plasmid mobilization relaxosome protein MobC [Staphylococcus aureus]
MSEQNTFVASDETVGRNRKPNRKAPKQISFRVSESEYLKLQQSAETLNMSVPAFVKKKAQGNQHQHEAPNYEALERNISELRERLDEVWKTLKEQ